MNKPINELTTLRTHFILFPLIPRLERKFLFMFKANRNKFNAQESSITAIAIIISSVNRKTVVLMGNFIIFRLFDYELILMLARAFLQFFSCNLQWICIELKQFVVILQNVLLTK